MNVQNYIEILKLIGALITSFFAFYKYLNSQLAKKMDKEELEKIKEELEKNFSRELNYIKENNKNIQNSFVEKLDDIKEDMTIIKNFLLNNKRE